MPSQRLVGKFTFKAHAKADRPTVVLEHAAAARSKRRGQEQFNLPFIQRPH
jgi:hypothetical protein